MPEITPSRYLVQASWGDVPHLDERAKADLLASTPEYMRDARSKGIPSLGAGAIYPIPWENVSCEPFPIPDHWRRGYGLDVGWNRTAAVWKAEDPATGVIYSYAEYYGSQAVPLIHAEAIKTRGAWIQGAIDPASRGRGQSDGKRLFKEYKALGLNLKLAENAVEAGLDHNWLLLEMGRHVYFRSLVNTEREYRLYRRARKVDENGVTKVKVVKKDDHLMDADRYGLMTFDKIARVRPAEDRGEAAFTQAADTRAGY